MTVGQTRKTGLIDFSDIGEKNMQEIEIVLSQLLYTGAGSVTTSAQELKAIFSSIPDGSQSGIKTIAIHNNGAADIFFGPTSSVTAASGAVIKSGIAREFPVNHLESDIFFIAASTIDARIEIWR